MPGSRERDGNHNVFERPPQMNKSKKSGSNTRHIVNPKSTATSPDAIESQAGNIVDTHDETDRRTLLPSDEETDRNPFPRPWKICGVGFMVLILCVAAAILGYCLGNHGSTKEDEDMTETLAKCVEEASMKNTMSHPDILSDLHDTYVNMFDSEPTHWLIDHYKHQVYSGSDQDQHLVADIVAHLTQLGVFDEIKVENYTALISLPLPEGSLIQVVNSSSEQVLYRERVLGDVQDQNLDTRRAYVGGSLENESNMTQYFVPPFVAYSKAASVKGELVNINYGSEEDMELLIDAGILLADKIALIKSNGGDLHANVPLVEIMRRMEQYNLSAVLVYSETEMCGTEVAYDNLNTVGDPQTPGYSAIDGVWRQPEAELNFPDIPVQTISCATAQRLLGRMSGRVAPPSWQGIYNGTMYMGRKSTKADTWFVQLDTTNHYQKTIIQNVVATIRGFITPRQVIMLGASRNTFLSGHQGEIASTDALLRLTRPLADLVRSKKWLPKRSISFHFWGGADFGDIGITEHMERERRQENVVAYIDMDIPQETQLFLGGVFTIITPKGLRDFVDIIVKKRLLALRDEEAYYADNYDYDDQVASGYGIDHIMVMEFQSMSYKEADDLRLHGTTIPLIQVVASREKYIPANGSPEQLEVTKLVGALMLSLADQTLLAYSNRDTASTIQLSIHKLFFQVQLHKLQNITDALRAQVSVLLNNTAIFDHMIDNMMDPSDPDHVNAINTILLQLQKQLMDIQNQIHDLSSSLPPRQVSDEFDLKDDGDAGYSAAIVQQFSELLVSLHNANNLMKTVHFQVITYHTNSTESIDMTDEDYDDLERGWI